MELNGTACLVTGGGSGLGAATAMALAGQGARVAVADINEPAAREVAGRIGGLALACDVAEAASAESAFGAAQAAHGPVRVLVNCAGVATAGRVVGRDGPLDLDAFARVVRINLIGSFNMLRLAATQMSAAEPGPDGERGVIVNTASVAAYEGQIGQCAYAASKAGVIGMTLPAARELARAGVRVVSIAPGLFLTPMLQALPADVQANLAGSVPYPARLGDPAEYAALVLHICANRMLNGETIRLDGALRMAPR